MRLDDLHPFERRRRLDIAALEACGIDVERRVAEAPPRVRAMLARAHDLGKLNPENARRWNGSNVNRMTVAVPLGGSLDISGAGANLSVHAWVRLRGNKPTANWTHNVVGRFGTYLSQNQGWFLDVLWNGTTNVVRFSVFSNNAGETAPGTTVLALNRWYQVGGIFPVGAAVWPFLNGVIDGGVASSRSLVSTNVPLMIGDRYDSASVPGDVTTCNAEIAEVAVWVARLTDNLEMPALGKGVSPHLIRPGYLRGFWQLQGPGGSPDADLSGFGNHGVIAGSLPQAEHSPTQPYTAIAG